MISTVTMSLDSIAPDAGNDARMKVSGKTTTFAVLGHPVGHSLSPTMQNTAFLATGLDAIYMAYDVHPSQLMDSIAAMGAMGFGGVNLTLPHKQVAFRGLQQLDVSAKELGAVNTVKFTQNGPVGYNTDGEGFIRAVQERFGGSVKGLNVFVYGCGGAGRAVALTCARAEAGRIFLANRTVPKALELAEEIRTKFPHASVDVCRDDEQCLVNARNSHLVVQATVIGLYKSDSSSILPPTAFAKNGWAVDLEYTHMTTPFMSAAMKAGACATNGLGMLLHQGALAFKIWTGQEAPIDLMRDALLKAIATR